MAWLRWRRHWPAGGDARRELDGEVRGRRHGGGHSEKGRLVAAVAARSGDARGGGEGWCRRRPRWGPSKLPLEGVMEVATERCGIGRGIDGRNSSVGSNGTGRDECGEWGRGGINEIVSGAAIRGHD